MTLDYFYGQAGKLFSFYRIPKALFQEQRFQNLSTDAKTLYGILLDRMSLSVKNEWFDKQGRVFIIFTIEDVKRALCCADNKATKLLRELENFGLIERKRRGLGKPSLVYVKNFSSDLSNERVQNRENHESGSPKNACQDPPKSRCNKNKKSKTERNNTNPILSDELEKMKNRKLLEEYFSRSLEIELLLRLYPDDEDTIYQIVDLLVDTCDSKRKLIRIAGDDKPAEVVLSRLKKLNGARAGVAAAQYELARIYIDKEMGDACFIGGANPYIGCERWLKKAAEQNYIYAEELLADKYYEGVYIVKDVKAAIYWYEKAANQGSVYAMYRAGYIYYSEPIDYNKAGQWFSLAAEKGDKDAEEVLRNNLRYNRFTKKWDAVR